MTVENAPQKLAVVRISTNHVLITSESLSFYRKTTHYKSVVFQRILLIAENMQILEAIVPHQSYQVLEGGDEGQGEDGSCRIWIAMCSTVALLL